MRTSLMTLLATLLALMGFAGAAHAELTTFEISGPNTSGVGNIYTITLNTTSQGLSSIQWDLVTSTATNQLGLTIAPVIPASDPTCAATAPASCNFSGANPVINPVNPNGLNGFGLFNINTPPLGPSTYTVGTASFDFAGPDQISFANLLGFDAVGVPLNFGPTPVLNILVDTDGDGLTDDEEIVLGTDPTNPDTDGDDLFDGTEVDMAAGSGCPDPLDPDSDDDGLSDGEEVALATDPCNPDTDGDGLADAVDPTPLDPGAPDSFIEESLRASPKES